MQQVRGRGLKQLEILFGYIFLLFPPERSWGPHLKKLRKPQPPPLNDGPVHHSWHDKYVISILVFTYFQRDGAYWLPLTELSWIPYVFGCAACLVAPPSSGTIPHAHLLLMGFNLV